MLKSFFLLITAMALGVVPLVAQVFKLDADVELTGAYFNPATSPEKNINTNFREDDPFNPFRGKLFAGIHLNDTFGFEAEFLFDSKAVKFDHTKNQPFRVDGFFLSIKGMADRQLNFWFGRIPTPVGTFSPRSYSHVNPLIGYPLAYHYKVPYNAFTLSNESANLALRDQMEGGATMIYEACWITGVSAFGNIQGIDYMLAVGQGTLTNPEAKSNGGVQIAGRIGRQFTSQIAAGVSGGIAPYLEYDNDLPPGVGVRDPKHVILGFDAAVSFEKLFLAGEVYYNSWDTPQYQVEQSIHAYSWYVEGQYFFVQNFFGAVRINQIMYDTITDPVTGAGTPWGYSVTRVESGVGFLPIPECTVKAVVQYNHLHTPASPDITVVALQTAFRFENIQRLIGVDSAERRSY